MPFIVHRDVGSKSSYSTSKKLGIEAPKPDRATRKEEIVIDVTSELRCLFWPQLAIRTR
ncbi:MULTISPECIES: hypothetical protein [Streptomyces]|uniref:Uncharacterized protein n=1 Tax=Streptomyces malaysiensis TaxID=92644 RepID=A0ABX6WE62_STRMQ|nr:MULTISPECIES: hypothetical protein [Streptomyces]MCC4321098.1 hypothetical protein [Streptomyces malaysiensis]MCM3812719.1 hypothetical protein [Streptomyces sp. DR7-3]QPI58895.1 hypothetical protein I1A49_31950 [Streptomyces solisilvae]UHH20531.1 hypothetical protein LUV23_32150 [Streptomyces sp. HNM0561]